MPENAYI
ncbi:uncharacterized protein FFNC_15669 [Fusarium fujikuroi]|nr:uncharacterized protein FFNC_15669 [Fusarium fujikuroi]